MDLSKEKKCIFMAFALGMCYGLTLFLLLLLVRFFQNQIMQTKIISRTKESTLKHIAALYHILANIIFKSYIFSEISQSNLDLDADVNRTYVMGAMHWVKYSVL